MTQSFLSLKNIVFKTKHHTNYLKIVFQVITPSHKKIINSLATLIKIMHLKGHVFFKFKLSLYLTAAAIASDHDIYRLHIFLNVIEMKY